MIFYYLRTRTFVGIQAPVPEFKGNTEKDKGNQHQTSDVKKNILVLQEIAGRIVGRKGERHDKANQPTKK